MKFEPGDQVLVVREITGARRARPAAAVVVYGESVASVGEEMYRLLHRDGSERFAYGDQLEPASAVELLADLVEPAWAEKGERVP
jgi:hypothetical protein